MQAVNLVSVRGPAFILFNAGTVQLTTSPNPPIYTYTKDTFSQHLKEAPVLYFWIEFVTPHQLEAGVY